MRLLQHWGSVSHILLTLVYMPQMWCFPGNDFILSSIRYSYLTVDMIELMYCVCIGLQLLQLPESCAQLRSSVSMRSNIRLWNLSWWRYRQRCILWRGSWRTLKTCLRRTRGLEWVETCRKNLCWWESGFSSLAWLPHTCWILMYKEPFFVEPFAQFF